MGTTWNVESERRSEGLVPGLSENQRLPSAEGFTGKSVPDPWCGLNGPFVPFQRK